MFQTTPLWKVVPLCEEQLKDVRKEDILKNGDFRKCNTYRGGGGYDQFPYIAEKRLNKKYENQFVVQLYGCSLKCFYCYVTQNGIFGEYKEYTTENLIQEFENSQQNVFHLMGGAPAIYLENWHFIINKMNTEKIFHSDFLLSEKIYLIEDLKKINKKIHYMLLI